jgi:hypothetical protein
MTRAALVFILGTLLVLPGAAFAQQGLQPASPGPQTVHGNRDPGARAMEQVAGMPALVREDARVPNETMRHAGPGMWTDTVMYSVEKNAREKAKEKK